MTKNKHLLVIILILVTAGIIITVFRIAPAQGNVEGSRFLLDTVVSIKIYKSRDKELLEQAFARIDKLEKLLSRYSPESDISRFNRADTGETVDMSPETIAVLNLALDYASSSNGAFDPTIGPLVDLWDIGGDFPRVPEPDEIAKTLPLVNYKQLQIDAVHAAVAAKIPGMILDLGGIAKGWIADNIVDFLQKQGAKYILVNLGGNVRVVGGKPNGGGFLIGMQDPFSERGDYVGIFTLSSGSVVSSGVYERYFESDGTRYHHILDTNTGWPIDNGVAAVTVISQFSADGDALSTTLFALGVDAGLELAAALDEVEAAFITTDGTIVLTPGAAALFDPARSNLDIRVWGTNPAGSTGQ